MQKVDIVAVTLTSPALFGIYKDEKLIETIESFEKMSDSLDLIFRDILDRFKIDSIFFARGPGSFMSIKLLYIFLKSISITTKVKLFATDGFYFCNNAPIKAIGDSSFVKNSTKIEIAKIKSKNTKFSLPKFLERDKFSSNIEPLYILPAV